MRLDTLGNVWISASVGAVREGVARLEAMLPQANRGRRQPVSAEHLCVGLQCGGSDGYSGITANPALGAAADLLVAHGGTAILSEMRNPWGQSLKVAPPT